MNASVKTLYVFVNTIPDKLVKFFHNAVFVDTSISTIRRQNALSLFQKFVEARVAAGDQPKGLEAAFAEKLGISGATWSMAKSGARPIGDRMARQFEHQCQMPTGWLDEEREPEGMSHAEQQFVALALKTWRRTNSDGRKRLRTLLKTWDDA